MHDIAIDYKYLLGRYSLFYRKCISDKRTEINIALEVKKKKKKINVVCCNIITDSLVCFGIIVERINSIEIVLKLNQVFANYLLINSLRFFCSL